MITKARLRKVLGIYLLIIAIAFIASWIFLTKYEKTRPLTIVETVISENVKTGKITDINNFVFSEYETEKRINDYVLTLVEDKEISFVPTVNKQEDIDYAYAITADSEPIIYVYIGKAESMGYEIKKAEINADKLTDISIRVEKDTPVYVNGIVLNLKGEEIEIPDIPEKYTENLVNGAVEYSVENLVPEPLVESGELEISQKGDVYMISSKLDDELYTSISEWAIGCGEAFAKYSRNDAGIGAVGYYFDTSSAKYTVIAGMGVQWNNYHEWSKYEDQKCESIIKISDTLYLCRVTLTQIEGRNGMEIPSEIDDLIYVAKTDYGLKVVHLEATT